MMASFTFECDFTVFYGTNCTEIRRYALIAWILCCGVTEEHVF